MALVKGTPLKVVFGKDSHRPGQLSREDDYKAARDILGEDVLSKLYFVKDDLKTQDIEMLQKLGIRKLDEGPNGVKKDIDDEQK